MICGRSKLKLRKAAPGSAGASSTSVSAASTLRLQNTRCNQLVVNTVGCDVRRPGCRSMRQVWHSMCDGCTTGCRLVIRSTPSALQLLCRTKRLQGSHGDQGAHRRG